MHPIENIMQTSMEKIRGMADVNTVIGEPIDAGFGTVLLPVSKVSLGFTVGGGEYGGRDGTKQESKCARDAQEGGDFPFAGLSAVGMCLKPLAFVTMEQGNVRVLPAAPACAADRIADIVPRMLKSLETLINAAVDNMNKKCENRGNGPHRCSGRLEKERRCAEAPETNGDNEIENDTIE